MEAKVAPSLLSADFGNLARDIEEINASKADYLHVDIMDGVFVPNISMGFPVLKAIKKSSQKPLDVHLMIVNPDQYVERFRDAGAEILTVHYEACTHLHRTIAHIKDCGMKAGVALNPATPVMMLRDIICDVDLVLLMSVNPGFGGQKFIVQTLNKVRELRQLITLNGSNAQIEIDGGVNDITGAQLAEAGADILVAGSYVFGADDPIKTIDGLKNL